jgi:hypothetical protein
MRIGKHYSQCEKFIFVGYSKDVKDYRFLQAHSNEIIIRIDLIFFNVSRCESLIQ